MADARIVLVLSENWTLVSPRDLPALVRIACEAEHAGRRHRDAERARRAGRRFERRPALMAQPPRLRGTRKPGPGHALAGLDRARRGDRCTHDRAAVALAAVIAPLRHPLLLAKQLATLDLLAGGRLVVQPTVSWSEARVRRAGRALPPREVRSWTSSSRRCRRPGQPRRRRTTASHFSFDDVYVEPKPHRPAGPAMWFGGQRLHEPLLRRLVRYGAASTRSARPPHAGADDAARAHDRRRP